MLIDEFGNKLPQSKIKKKDKSKTRRMRRVSKGRDINPAFCNECGYRARSIGHLEGRHHLMGLEV